MNYTCYPDPRSEHEAIRSSHEYILKCDQTMNKTGVLYESCVNVKDIFTVLNLISKLRCKFPYDNMPENPGLLVEHGAKIPNYP